MLASGGEIRLAAGHAFGIERIAGPEDGVDQRVDRRVPGIAAEESHELMPFGEADLAPQPDPVAERPPVAPERQPARLGLLQLGDDRRGLLARSVDPAGPRQELLREDFDPVAIGFVRRERPLPRPLRFRRNLCQEGRLRLLDLLDLPGELGGFCQQFTFVVAGAEAGVLEVVRRLPLLAPGILAPGPRQRHDLPTPRRNPRPVLHRRPPSPRVHWVERAASRARLFSTVLKRRRPVSPKSEIIPEISRLLAQPDRRRGRSSPPVATRPSLSGSARSLEISRNLNPRGGACLES